MADAYILTKGTTYKWDTCAPHSILKSLGGDVIEFRAANTDEKPSITYSSSETNCNINGVIAYKNVEVLEKITALLSL